MTKKTYEQIEEYLGRRVYVKVSDHYSVEGTLLAINDHGGCEVYDDGLVFYCEPYIDIICDGT